MWKLSLPDNNDSINELIIALTYKNGDPKYSLSEEEVDSVNSIYLRYEEIEGTPNPELEGRDLSRRTRSAIQEGYKEVQIKRRLAGLRSRLMLAADRCPCCGISVVTDLDHHLPNSVYKPLSVYSSNLIPFCHKCNNKKRAHASTDPSEQFVHVYYDEVPEDVQFLVAGTSLLNGALIVNYTVVHVDEMDGELYERINFQINRIQLNIRLKQEVNIFLFSFLVSLDGAYGGGGNAVTVAELLDSYAEYFSRKMGLNDWRTALLISLSNNEEFCDGGFRSCLGL